MLTFTQRVLGAMRLDPATYEEVEADRGALSQAVVVVIAFSTAAGAGLAGAASTPRAILAAIGGSLVGWLSWASLVYYLGAKLFPAAETRADVGQLARTVGFSAAPGVLLVLLAVPFFRPAVFAGVSLWMLASMVVAVRQALDFKGTGRAVAICAAGGVLVLVAAFVIGSSLAPSVS